jgi:prevent-host-death family protein
MSTAVSKSQFRARAAAYLRRVESEGAELIITDQGRPVARIIPWRPADAQVRESLLASVIEYIDPTEPVGLQDWEALR